ncbi:LIM-domain binding protein-domain-containing protein [Whalleya microplaca]|nr:LIM-domain binding protein-domain-containing protein [Whalleya microplaca]
MMASMGPGGFHPGMQQHPGVHPNHPMGAPGMAHNPSQPGVQPGMPPQMAGHMAVSGPGGQANPAAMMGGMPPGAGGPSAHALQHLNPQQMFQHQQAQQLAFAQNPQMMAQLQQQRMFQQRQQQAMIQQQMYGGGMPMNMQGMNMAGMTAAQFQAMRNNPNMQRVLPQHLQQAHQMSQQGQHQSPQHTQQLLAQQLALQQQHAQQQANNHMHQGNQPGHPQMTPQQLQLQAAQQAQMAQSMAQQVPQGSQNQGPQPQSQPQGQPQQQGPQQQPPQQQGQQPPSQQPGQQPQPNSQGPQRAPTPAGSQPNQPQSQGPNPAQTSQPQQPQAQGQPQNNQQNQAQHQQPNPQLLQAAHHQQQLANNLQQMQQQQQQKNDGMKGHCLLKLLQFGEHLSGYIPNPRVKDDITYWNSFVAQFFSPRGVFRLSLFCTSTDPSTEEHTDKQYEITRPALPRYFHTHYQSGIKRINLTFEKGTSDKPLPNGCHFIENPKTSLTYWFDSSHVVATGTLRAQFDSEQKLELLEFITAGHEEFHSRKMVIEAALPAHSWVKEWMKVNGQDSRLSPEMSKKGKPKLLKSPPNPPPDIDLPQSAVKQNMGITEAVFQFLEIVEVMGQMSPLFQFHHEHPDLSPYSALDQYVNSHITNVSQQPVMNGQPQANGPTNPRTPSFSQFPMGASPAAQHLQLPNSPHMGSPAQGHMQAPGMQMQPSQQGTSSSGPSANTSPASNKRRRPSTVKTEEEGGAPAPANLGGAQVNGVGMTNKKQTTPRLQKRIKGNPA